MERAHVGLHGGLLPGCVRRRRTGYWLILLLLLAVATAAKASVAVLMEESYGDLGAFEPAGHTAIYLSHVCAASPLKLRTCRPGEFGVVIGRYHRIDGYDWIAIPLVPYLYATDDAREVPPSVDRAQVAALRDAYRRKYLESLAPDDPDGKTPSGDWTQLVGSVYDRTVHGFQLISTPEQDARFIAIFNDRRNRGHYNGFFNNCADFARLVLNIYLPHAVHRNIIADFGMTTPKQVARSLIRYGHKHPELQMSAFVIPQVPGTLPRSHAVDGVAEMLVKSKKYLLPLAVLSPQLTAAVVVAYLTDGRMKLPQDATVFDMDDIETGHGPGNSPPLQPVKPSGELPHPTPAVTPVPTPPAATTSPSLP